MDSKESFPPISVKDITDDFLTTPQRNALHFYQEHLPIVEQCYGVAQYWTIPRVNYKFRTDSNAYVVLRAEFINLYETKEELFSHKKYDTPQWKENSEKLRINQNTHPELHEETITYYRIHYSSWIDKFVGLHEGPSREHIQVFHLKDVQESVKKFYRQVLRQEKEVANAFGYNTVKPLTENPAFQYVLKALTIEDVKNMLPPHPVSAVKEEIFYAHEVLRILCQTLHNTFGDEIQNTPREWILAAFDVKDIQEEALNITKNKA